MLYSIIIAYFATYADDTTSYVRGKKFSEVINFLESYVTNVYKRFHEDDGIANSRKNHYLIYPYEKKSIQIQN